MKDTTNILPNNPPPNSPRFSFRGLVRPNVVAVGILVIVIIIAAVGVYWHNHSNSTSKSQATTPTVLKQSFTQVNPFTLAGETTDSGATFNRPSEFGSGNDSGKGHASFNEMTSNSDYQNVPLGEMSATTTPLQVPFTAADLAYLSKTMNSSATNQQAVASLKSYVTQNMPTGYTVKLGAVKPLVSSNIKTNAWLVSATATPTSSTNSSTLPDQEGELAYAIGQKGIYYLMIIATDYNWTSSQTALQNVFNSLKIDQ